MSVNEASLNLLALKFGILPVEVARAHSAANLFFNLASYPAPLLGTQIHATTQKERAKGTFSLGLRGLERRFEADFKDLGLLRHFPTPGMNDMQSLAQNAEQGMACPRAVHPHASPFCLFRPECASSSSWKKSEGSQIGACANG